MGNCCHPFGSRNDPSNKRQKKVVLLLVGLDNAGKTTAAKNLIGEPTDVVVPTVGFSTVSLKHQGYSVTIYDLGGGPQIRGIWHRYFVDVHGIIFVVDASDVTRLEEGREVLKNLLTHEKLAGKPMLVLANKQDREGALDEVDIVERLNLEVLVNQQRCPTLVEMCSATAAKNARRKIDPAIYNGFRWLMNCIIRDYKNINKRVQEDVTIQKKITEQEKKERLERILKAREERGETAIENGNCNQGTHEDSDSDVVIGDPFKPITEHVKKPSPVPLEPYLENKIILVKESPNKVMPGTDETDSTDNKATLNTKSLPDISGEELILEARAESKQNLRTGSGDNKKLFGSAVSISNLPSPAHSITGVIKDQLGLSATKHNKRSLLHRTNKTAPAPLGPSDQQSMIEEDIHQVGELQTKKKPGPPVLRKQAFVEHTSPLKEEQISPLSHGVLEKQMSVDKTNIFCVRTAETSYDQEENLDSAVEIYMTSSADSRQRKKPLMGRLSLVNSKVQPISAETSLSNSFNADNFLTSVESDQITVVKHMSSDSASLTDSQKDVHPRSPVPIKQWDIDKFSLQNDSDKNSENTRETLNGPSDEVKGTEACALASSRPTSAGRNSAQQSNLRKQKSADAASIGSARSTKSREDSGQLSDSGFVSPKTVLPPLRPLSSVERPPWILPPLSLRSKQSSQDSYSGDSEVKTLSGTTNVNNEGKPKQSQGEVKLSHDQAEIEENQASENALMIYEQTGLQEQDTILRQLQSEEAINNCKHINQKKAKLLQKFQEILDQADSDEDIDIIQRQIKPILPSIQARKSQLKFLSKPDFAEQKGNKFEPQRRLFSTKKNPKKSALSISRPTVDEQDNIAAQLLLQSDVDINYV